MRIAIFSNTYVPSPLNGVAVSTDSLRMALEGLGHEVYVFAPAPKDYDLSKDDERIYRLASARHQKTSYLIAFPYILPHPGRKSHKLPKFDVVHTQHFNWVGEWGRLFSSLHGYTLVSTSHTQYKEYSKLFAPIPTAVIDDYIDWQMPRHYNSCDLITTPAESAKRRLESCGIRVPIKVIANSIDRDRYLKADGAAVRHELGCKESDILVGYIGRLSEEKSLGDLVRVAALLKDLPSTRFVIVGDGSCKDELLRQTVACGVGDRIQFAGAIDRERVPDYYAALDLFVSPSCSEVQPVSFAEAMASSAVPIVMDAPGGADMIEDGVDGRLISPNEKVLGMVGAIRELIANPIGFEKMKWNACESSKRYSRPVIGKAMVEAYQQAMAIHQSR